MEGPFHRFQPRDASRLRVFTSNVKSLTALTGTANVDYGIFTGAVRIHRIGLVVQSALGNHTDAKLAIYDGTTTVLLTNTTGAALTNFVAGSTAFRGRLSTSAGSLVATNGGSIFQYNTAYNDVPVNLNSKGAADTFLRYTFTTSDNPTSGSLRFYVLWEPLTDDALIIPN